MSTKRSLRTLLFIVLALSLAACGGTDSADSSTTTTDGGDIVEPPRLTPGPATVETVEFAFLESDPVQVIVTISGTVPTPCHNLILNRPDDDTIEVSSRYDEAEVCTQVLGPFVTQVNIGSRPDGPHTLTVNGVEYDYGVGDANA